MLPRTSFPSGNRPGVQYTVDASLHFYENNNHKYYLVTESGPGSVAIKRILVEISGISANDFSQWLGVMQAAMQLPHSDALMLPIDYWQQGEFSFYWIAAAANLPLNTFCQSLPQLLTKTNPDFLDLAEKYLYGCASAETLHLNATSLLYCPQTKAVLVDTSPQCYTPNTGSTLYNSSPLQYRDFFLQLSQYPSATQAHTVFLQRVSQLAQPQQPQGWNAAWGQQQPASQPRYTPDFTRPQAQPAVNPSRGSVAGALGKVVGNVARGMGLAGTPVGQNPNLTPTHGSNAPTYTGGQPGAAPGKKPFQTPPGQPQQQPQQRSPLQQPSVVKPGPARPAVQAAKTAPVNPQPRPAAPVQQKTVPVINVPPKAAPAAKTPPKAAPQPAPQPAPAVKVWPFTEYRLRALPEVGSSVPAVHDATGKAVIIERHDRAEKDLLKFLQASQHHQLRHPPKPVPGLCLLHDVNTDADPKSFYVVRDTIDATGWLPVGHPTLLALDQKDKLTIAHNMAAVFAGVIADGWLPSQIVESSMLVNPKDFTVCFADGHLLSTEKDAPLTCTLGYAAPECTGKKPKAELPAVSYALAVWLFRLFVGGFPMEGRKTLKALKAAGKPEAEMAAKLYGDDAVFCLHPTNDENSLVGLGGHYAEQQRRWTATPDALRLLWVKTFVGHLHRKIDDRPAPGDWLEAIDKLL